MQRGEQEAELRFVARDFRNASEFFVRAHRQQEECLRRTLYDDVGDPLFFCIEQYAVTQVGHIDFIPVGEIEADGEGLFRERETEN